MEATNRKDLDFKVAFKIATSTELAASEATQLSDDTRVHQNLLPSPSGEVPEISLRLVAVPSSGSLQVKSSLYMDDIAVLCSDALSVCRLMSICDWFKLTLGPRCRDYRQGVLTGDLCEDLCVTQTMVYKRCLYYDKGKKVIQADWNGQPIILKSKLENFLSYESLYLLDERESRPIPDVDILVFTALEIKHSLGLEVKNVTIPQLWTKHLKGRTGSFSRAELSSMWSLFQQEEYVFFQLLQNLSKHVLRVIGSCGHFYAVEYLTAGHAWHRSLFSLEKLVPLSWRGSSRKAWWQVTNGIALSFLELARHFENDFSHQLHLCDIKPENFAIRADLTVVAIDVDMAFFEPKMRAILEQNCTDDEDCNFFDCFSRCNIETKKCRAERSNNNLQVSCNLLWLNSYSLPLKGSCVSSFQLAFLSLFIVCWCILISLPKTNFHSALSVSSMNASATWGLQQIAKVAHCDLQQGQFRMDTKCQPTLVAL
ncbi:LOW QUALITY PROTEIN: divergent protein kinase domain 1C [Rhincodon typus]|uniref:LOW QUALITY PROTEIN: divergent protein kinase domain 1C n=1 Tax=Rhincodon typus TaxID=259920 RepID=UPI00202E5BF8|nr:LOW QUALITY PROTEIN: divergent protein kinase domain 1C [Rhincodon typus]